MGPTESLWHDIRMAFRVLSKSPGATVLALLSIALGIGLTTGTFAIADAILLRPFPLPRPAELLHAVSTGEDGRPVQYGWPDYEDMVQAGRNVAEMAAYERRGLMFKTGEDSEFILAHAVSANYFSLLGVRASLGRASVEEIGGRPAAVLGYRLWQRRFGGDPQIVGKTILLSQEAFHVSGVMPAEFTGLMRGVATDVWVSTDAWFDVLGNRAERQQRSGQFEIVARLRPGTSRESASAQLDAAIRGEGKRKPAPAGAAGIVLKQSFAPNWKTNLAVGGGMLVMLFLIMFVACANVTQLRLAQAEMRKRDLGIHMALGAGVWPVIRQLLVETCIVSTAGIALALLLAQFVMRQASTFLSAVSTYLDYGIRLDLRVLMYTLSAGLFVILLSGLAPACHAVRLELAEVLKSEQGTGAAAGGWQKKALIVGQIAVSVALFGTAAMFLLSLRNAVAIRPGFEPDKRLLIIKVFPGSRMQTSMWCEQACERLSGLPGVRAATYARRMPLSGSGGGATVQLEVPGQPPLGVFFNNVGGNYFDVMGTRVIAGRGINASDREGGQPVVVISRHLARMLFENRNPLGEWFLIAGKLRQVVGVAEDAPSNNLHEEPEPYLYLPFTQYQRGDVTLIVETVGEPGAMTRAVGQEVTRFDLRAMVYSAITLHDHMDNALSEDRMMATLASCLGVFGILLTCAGLFGVVQYAVNRRTREFGVRLALGAEPASIRRMVLVESVRLAAVGIPFGLMLLVASVRYLHSMVLGVSPLNPALYVVSAAAAIAVAFAAGWFPAQRATRVDPIQALRQE